MLGMFRPRNPKLSVSNQALANPTERYRFISFIGKGAYASVYRAYDEMDEIDVAVKIISLNDSEDDIENIQNEIIMQAALNAPQLTRYYVSYVVGTNLWIVMELLEGGSLADVIWDTGPLDEEAVAYVMHELLLALDYLHGQGMVHRDIKAGNLLASSDGQVKLADFGVAAQLAETLNHRTDRIGSAYWMAPEVISEACYDGCADIWSAGITAIELAHGVPPYAGKVSAVQVIYLIAQSPAPTLDTTVQFSDVFRDFVAQCLIKLPSRRPTAAHLLKHPFLRSANRTDKWMYRVAEAIRKKRDVEIPIPVNIFGSNISMGRVASCESMGGGWDFNCNVSNKSGKSGKSLGSTRSRRVGLPLSMLSSSGSPPNSAKGNGLYLEIPHEGSGPVEYNGRGRYLNKDGVYVEGGSPHRLHVSYHSGYSHRDRVGGGGSSRRSVSPTHRHTGSWSGTPRRFGLDGWENGMMSMGMRAVSGDSINSNKEQQPGDSLKWGQSASASSEGVAISTPRSQHLNQGFGRVPLTSGTNNSVNSHNAAASTSIKNVNPKSNPTDPCAASSSLNKSTPTLVPDLRPSLGTMHIASPPPGLLSSRAWPTPDRRDPTSTLPSPTKPPYTHSLESQSVFGYEFRDTSNNIPEIRSQSPDLISGPGSSKGSISFAKLRQAAMHALTMGFFQPKTSSTTSGRSGSPSPSETLTNSQDSAEKRSPEGTPPALRSPNVPQQQPNQPLASANISSALATLPFDTPAPRLNLFSMPWSTSSLLSQSAPLPPLQTMARPPMSPSANSQQRFLRPPVSPTFRGSAQTYIQSPSRAIIPVTAGSNKTTTLSESSFVSSFSTTVPKDALPIQAPSVTTIDTPKSPTMTRIPHSPQFATTWSGSPLSQSTGSLISKSTNRRHRIRSQSWGIRGTSFGIGAESDRDRDDSLQCTPSIKASPLTTTTYPLETSRTSVANSNGSGMIDWLSSATPSETGDGQYVDLVNANLNWKGLGPWAAVQSTLSRCRDFIPQDELAYAVQRTCIEEGQRAIVGGNGNLEDSLHRTKQQLPKLEGGYSELFMNVLQPAMSALRETFVIYANDNGTVDVESPDSLDGIGDSSESPLPSLTSVRRSQSAERTRRSHIASLIDALSATLVALEMETGGEGTAELLTMSCALMEQELEAGEAGES